MKKILFLIFTIPYVGLANENWSCQDYLKLHSQSQCSKNHYLKNFAFKYCNRYEKNKDRFSLQGQIWIENVKQCLLKSTISSFKSADSCQEIAQKAFQDHSYCYVKYGYCALSSKDKHAVFLTVLDSFYQFNTYRSAYQVQTTCLNYSNN